MSSKVPDYKLVDYRGFIFVVHEIYGLLLLYCTRKPKKGPHYQLPGGHVDGYEFEAAAKKCGGDALAQTIILEACKLGASRELYEETGIDIRCKLERLKPAALQRSTDAMDMLGCMLKDKCYFHLVVSDEDFFSLSKEGRNDERLTSSNNGSGPSLMLKISEEHSGFIFEPDPHESVKKLKQHSGGSGSIALHMSMRSNSTRGVPNPNAAPESEHGGHNRAIAKVCEKEEVPPPPTRKGLWSCFC